MTINMGISKKPHGFVPLAILLLLGVAPWAMAQRAGTLGDTTLKNATIEIIQTYKPQVKQVPKPGWIPQLPPIDTTHAPFPYDVPQQTLYYTYSSLPLRPLALGKDTAPKPFANYVKAGGGNLSTFLLDAGIGSLVGKNYETAINLHHLSQSGAIKYQQSSLSNLTAMGTLHKENVDIHSGINIDRNQYHFYGYDHSLPDPGRDSIRQVYTGIGIHVGLNNRPQKNSHISYQPTISGSLYSAKFNTSETAIGFDAPLTIATDSTLHLHMGLSGSLVNYKYDSGNTNNNYLMATPGLSVTTGSIWGQTIVGLALGKNNKFYLLPDIAFSHKMAKQHALLSLGWKATLRQNTFQQLSSDNPFIYPTYTPLQTRKDDVYVHASLSRGNHFTCAAKVSWMRFNNLATFLNDTLDNKQFRIEYINTDAVVLQVSARYQVGNYWSAGIMAELYNFYGTSDKQIYVWHQPSTKLTADVSVNISNKLSISAWCNLLGGIYAKNNNDEVLKMILFADIGTQAEYLIVPRLSAFVAGNNLLNQKYQRWYGYQAYGISLMGGLRLKF